MSKSGDRGKKIVALAMYLLPVVFFVVCYFLIVTSGEDIYQGANTAPDLLGDAVDAFRYNARLSDMYAWSVINFFDYRFSFGVDVIFRLLDVLAGTGIIYLMTYLALGRRPRLRLMDAGLFLAGFVMIFLTPHGAALYGGFSVIHNYLIITLAPLLFAIPYLRTLRGEEITKWWMVPVMLVGGVVFGLSSNLTPLAFFATYALVKIYQVRKNGWRMRGWEIAGLVGLLAGVGVAYLCGPGVSSYVDSDYVLIYDYIPLSALFSNPLPSILAILKHIVINCARVFGPAMVVAGVALVLLTAERRRLPKWRELRIADPAARKVFVVAVIFAVVHTLAGSQIRFPLRIGLPGYIAAVVAVGILLVNWLTGCGRGLRGVAVGMLMILAVFVLTARTVLAVRYLQQVGPLLDEIRESEQTEICVPKERIRSRNLPVIYLGQEDMLVEWAMPEMVYGKAVRFCELE